MADAVHHSHCALAQSAFDYVAVIDNSPSFKCVLQGVLLTVTDDSDGDYASYRQTCETSRDTHEGIGLFSKFP